MNSLAVVVSHNGKAVITKPLKPLWIRPACNLEGGALVGVKNLPVRIEWVVLFFGVQGGFPVFDLVDHQVVIGLTLWPKDLCPLHHFLFVGIIECSGVRYGVRIVQVAVDCLPFLPKVFSRRPALDGLIFD